MLVRPSTHRPQPTRCLGMDRTRFTSDVRPYAETPHAPHWPLVFPMFQDPARVGSQDPYVADSRHTLPLILPTLQSPSSSQETRTCMSAWLILHSLSRSRHLLAHYPLVSCIHALLAIYTDARAYRPSASLLAFLAGREPKDQSRKPHQYFLRGSMSALSFPKLPGDVKD